jgi:hypothetical protein
MGVAQRDLDQAFEDLGRKYQGLKEDYFALLYLAQEFGGEPEGYVHQVAFGGNDYGLDAFHIARELRNLYLYQFKWTEDHKQFKGSLNRLISAGMERIFGDPYQDNRQNQFLMQLKAALHEHQEVIDRVYVQFIFNGNPEAAENSAVLGNLREDLESKKHYIDDYFNARPVTLSVQFLSNETRRVGGVLRVKKTHRYDIPMEEIGAHPLDSGEVMHVAFVPLLQLHRIHREMGERLFERNIRSGLAGDRAPNRAIRRALLSIAADELDPALFTFHHKGVTIAAEKLERENGMYRVTEPRVLNGAQTLTSVDQFFQENERHPALQRNREPLESVKVLARIITGASDDFLVRVTIANNKQNPVASWNLRASDRIQLELHDKFREELKIFYERQEASFGALSDSEREEMGIEHARAIEIKRLAQTFLAVQGEIDRMSRLPDVFENDLMYGSTFRESFLSASASRILLAYKIQFRIRRIAEEIIGAGSRYQFLRRSNNLLWALLIQALLNDPKLARYEEVFGESLVIEADYTELLKRLASKFVRPLIYDTVIRDEKRKEALEAGKVSFLRSKALYDECMRAAHERYGWVKKKNF